MLLAEAEQTLAAARAKAQDMRVAMAIFPRGIPAWREGSLIGAVSARCGAVEQDHACALAGVLAIRKATR